MSKISQLAKNLGKKLILIPQNIANPAHVNLKPSIGYDSSLGGKAFVRLNKDGKKELSEIKPSSYKDLELLAFGGVDFDSKFHIAALLKSIESLIPETNTLKYGAIYPNADRQTRFEAATTYNMNKLHYTPYIEELTRTYILPRFINETTLDLQEPETPITLYSFSVAAREIMMIENCLRSILQKEYKTSNSDIYALFSYLNALCIAYAIDYTNVPELRFPKTVILSRLDDGILYPQALLAEISSIPNLNSTKIHEFTLKDDSKYSHDTEVFYVNHPLVIAEGYKMSKNGHSLPHYIDIIKTTELYDIVSTILGATNNDCSDNLS